jgi:hypothetical protein
MVPGSRWGVNARGKRHNPSCAHHGRTTGTARAGATKYKRTVASSSSIDGVPVA